MWPLELSDGMLMWPALSKHHPWGGSYFPHFCIPRSQLITAWNTVWWSVACQAPEQLTSDVHVTNVTTLTQSQSRPNPRSWYFNPFIILVNECEWMVAKKTLRGDDPITAVIMMSTPDQESSSRQSSSASSWKWAIHHCRQRLPLLNYRFKSSCSNYYNLQIGIRGKICHLQSM